MGCRGAHSTKLCPPGSLLPLPRPPWRAVEGYAEAVAFRTYLREGRLVRQEEVGVAEVEEYLGGVLDFTGELGRLAIAQATRRDEQAVQQARDLVEAIMGQFLQVGRVVVRARGGRRRGVAPAGCLPAAAAGWPSAASLNAAALAWCVQFDLRNGSLRKKVGGLC